MNTFRAVDLEAYLDEALPAEQMARVEQALRSDGQLLARLAEIAARRDSGMHSLGEIWRRHRLSCPSREQLGSFLLGATDSGQAGAIRFHLEAIGCRYCQANLADLKQQQEQKDTATQARRTRYFQSSAGYLKK